MERLLLVSLILASRVWTASGYCPNDHCPKYETIEEHEEYEKRLYNATTWISTDIRGPWSTDVIAANAKLKEYCGKLSDEDCEKLRDGWPATITVTKDANYLSWFVYTDMTLSEDADLSVRVRDRPKGVVYVRSFGGIPSKEKGLANAEALWRALDKTCADMPTYSGASYQPYMSLTHHNEVWIYADDVCEGAE